MSESIDSVIEGFPYSTIEKHIGEPHYQAIKEVERKIIKNASSYPSELGGGNHGYLGLILSPLKYELLTGILFNPHPNPGSFPTFPPNPTQPQIAQINATHKEALRLWREQNALIKAIKKQITNAFEDKNLKEIEDTYTGFNNVTIQDIFTYLYDRFGDVTPTELEEAEKTLNEPFNPNEPFGLFICTIEDAVDIAEAAGCPFTPQQAMNKALTNIMKAQALPDVAIREWRNKSTSDKTWSNFKAHFSKEVKDYQKDQGLTAKSAYHVANATNQAANQAANQALLQAQADFRSLTENIINEFRTANTPPDPPVADYCQQAHAATASTDLINIIKELRNEVNDLKNKENVNPNKGYRRQRNLDDKPWQYCWTHGANKSHCSGNCKNSMPGHKTEATLKDRKGGCAFRMSLKSVKDQLNSS